MTKAQARTTIEKLKMHPTASMLRVHKLQQAEGWLDLVNVAVLAQDQRAVSRRLAEYEKNLEVAFA